MRPDVLMLAIPLILGGGVNLFFPELAISLSRSIQTKRTQALLPPFFFSIGLVRFVGAMALTAGLAFVAVWCWNAWK